MNGPTIAALCTGIVGIIGAVTSLIVAIKAHGKATQAQAAAHIHMDVLHDDIARLSDPEPEA